MRCSTVNLRFLTRVLLLGSVAPAVVGIHTGIGVHDKAALTTACLEDEAATLQTQLSKDDALQRDELLADGRINAAWHPRSPAVNATNPAAVAVAHDTALAGPMDLAVDIVDGDAVAYSYAGLTGINRRSLSGDDRFSEVAIHTRTSQVDDFDSLMLLLTGPGLVGHGNLVPLLIFASALFIASMALMLLGVSQMEPLEKQNKDNVIFPFYWLVCNMYDLSLFSAGVPGAYQICIGFGGNAALSGLFISLHGFAALVAGWVVWCLDDKMSCRTGIQISFAVQYLGVIMMVMSSWIHSIPLILLARVFMGFGAASANQFRGHVRVRLQSQSGMANNSLIYGIGSGLGMVGGGFVASALEPFITAFWPGDRTGALVISSVILQLATGPALYLYAQFIIPGHMTVASPITCQAERIDAEESVEDKRQEPIPNWIKWRLVWVGTVSGMVGNLQSGIAEVGTVFLLEMNFGIPTSRTGMYAGIAAFIGMPLGMCGAMLLNNVCPGTIVDKLRIIQCISVPFMFTSIVIFPIFPKSWGCIMVLVGETIGVVLGMGFSGVMEAASMGIVDDRGDETTNLSMATLQLINTQSVGFSRLVTGPLSRIIIGATKVNGNMGQVRYAIIMLAMSMFQSICGVCITVPLLVRISTWHTDNKHYEEEDELKQDKIVKDKFKTDKFETEKPQAQPTTPEAKKQSP